jgi:putative glutamate/gamma-aminobutyrate antiporter
MAENSANSTVTKPAKIGVFTLVMISAAFIVSVRNLPMLAETGFHMIFYGLVAVMAFLVPVALASAELATGWPKQGGVYAWVGEAFGERWGFVAIWLQWIQMVFGMVTVLAFIAGSIAYLFDSSLADNGLFIFGVVCVVYWGATLLNFKGMKLSGIISTVCLIGGVLIPGALIIALGIIYMLKGDASQMSFAFTAENLFPDFTSFQNVALMSGIIFIFSGMEVSAAHANEVRNPQRNYPIAILCAAVLMVFLNIVGAMSVGVVVPHDEINLAAGVMEAFRAFFDKFNLLWLLPIVAGLTAFGAMGQVSTWIVGPVKGLLSTADNGDLPPVFQKVNKNGIPVRLLVVQASLVTFFGLLFAVIPGVNEAFMMLLNVLIMLYCCMYILMFLSVLRLRYSEPDVKRAYKMPFGTIGVWLINCVGIAASIFVLFIGFFPPSQLDISSAGIYRLFIAVSLVVLLAIPFIIFALKKPTWKKEVQNAK